MIALVAGAGAMAWVNAAGLDGSLTYLTGLSFFTLFQSFGAEPQ